MESAREPENASEDQEQGSLVRQKTLGKNHSLCLNTTENTTVPPTATPAKAEQGA